MKRWLSMTAVLILAVIIMSVASFVLEDQQRRKHRDQAREHCIVTYGNPALHSPERFWDCVYRSHNPNP